MIMLAGLFIIGIMIVSAICAILFVLGIIVAFFPFFLKAVLAIGILMFLGSTLGGFGVIVGIILLIVYGVHKARHA